MLNIPVRVPDAEELSGIGATYAAGIASGLYDENVFGILKRTSYSPSMSEDEREIKRDGWKSAVNKAI